MMPGVLKNDLFATLPEEQDISLLNQIQRIVNKSNIKIIVLDDDPTGTQTVHDVPVLTTWSVDELSKAFLLPSPVFYLLTNSRSLPEDQAESLNREIAHHLRMASQQTDCKFVLVSRSDSTLRGHYPAEIEWLIDSLQMACDGVILVPFFAEGGRYTIDDVHYVAEGDRLLPAGETEFANDPAFGYRNSNLRRWVVEKHGGIIGIDDVATISLKTLRRGGSDAVCELLLQLKDQQPCVVNAVSYRDLEIFVLGLLNAESLGKKFIYRTAASFVRIRAGISQRPLLTRKEINISEDHQMGGIVVVGSYVGKTTRQLNALVESGLAHPVEVSVGSLINDEIHDDEVFKAIEKTEAKLVKGINVVIFTSRKKLNPESHETFLEQGQMISNGLVNIVRGLSVKPRWIIGKGGITSSVVATQGLGVKQAQVLGQILPGVPVWQLGPESQAPGRAYVVFPGNVGDDLALVEIVRKFSNM